MFKTPQELQSFIIWAKDQKIKTLKVGEISVEFHELAFLADYQQQADITNGGASTLADTEPMDPKEEEELQFWSSI